MVLEFKEKAGRKWYVPLPYKLLVNLAVRETWFRMALKYNGHLSDAEVLRYMSYLEAIDFGELREVVKSISERGLTLVEIDAKDGTYVSIKS